MTTIALAVFLAVASPQEPEARISLDVKDSDIQDMARLFADIGASAADSIHTSTVLGDPAVRLRIYPY